MGSQRESAVSAAREHYDRIAEVYEFQRFGCRCGSILNEVELKTVTGLIPPGSRILDVGAGTGRFSRASALQGCEVVSIDASSKMTRMQMSANKNIGLTAATAVVRGAAEFLPFRATSFDVILSIKLLSHHQRIDPYVSEMVRVLRPNGILILDIPHRFAPSYRKLKVGTPVESHTDYFHSKAEVKRALQNVAVNFGRIVSYGMLPSSLIHAAVCSHPRLFPIQILRLLLDSKRGLLSFVQGVKHS